jgi:helicase
MKLKDLTKFGIPALIIEAWTRRQGDYLLPLQEKAIRAGLLDETVNDGQQNLIISAPTSSGKSFCGEMAAMGALLRRRKAVMLLPLKSIAEEKYDYFRNCYRDIGIRTIIVSRDHPENDIDFELGNFDLALAIYEKFNRLLTVNLDILQQIGLVVIDELQMISDPSRGGELEVALTKIIGSGYSPRMVALSAVLENNTELADWLDCGVVSETVRPIDLLQGVAGSGSFRYRSFNSGFEGSEKITLDSDSDNLAEKLIEFLKSDKSQKLVFLKSRRDTIDAALALAGTVSWPEAKTTLVRLEGEENSFLIRSLKQALSRGVAFHNADLTAGQRQAIEDGYRQGQIRIIFSTTTLAMGVNLPAETVLLETMKYTAGVFGGKATLVPITIAEFQNITGRAGRFGLGAAGRPGKAIVLAASEFEHEVLWSEYIDSRKNEKHVSILGSTNIHDIILDLIVSGFNSDAEKLEHCLQNLFYSRGRNLLNGTDLNSILIELSSENLLGEGLNPTQLGIAVAESGITIKSCRQYLKLLTEKYPETKIGWLFIALNAGEFDISRCGLTSFEYHRRIYEKLLYQHFNEYVNEIDVYTVSKINHEPLDFHSSAILKSLFVLAEWAEGKTIERLEQRYQLHHGQIINLAETAAWLLASIGRIIHALDGRSNLPRLLDDYAFNLQFGISPEMREICSMLGTVLNRADYKALENGNIKSLTDLRTGAQDTLNGSRALSEIIKPEGKLRRVLDSLENSEKEDKMRKKTRSNAVNIYRPGLSGDGPYGVDPTLIELDGAYEKERYLVKIDGFPVRLTGKSFMYLAKLAFARLTGGDGWTYKDDIEVGFNQARYLYRLRQEIKDGGFSWPIFENNRLGYYRLDLEPEKIRLNLDNLRNHPDYQLRKIIDELAPRLAG